MVWHGEGCAPPCVIALSHHMMMKTNKDTIPALSSPGKRTGPSAGNQGRGDKYATGNRQQRRSEEEKTSRYEHGMSEH